MQIAERHLLFESFDNGSGKAVFSINVFYLVSAYIAKFRLLKGAYHQMIAVGPYDLMYGFISDAIWNRVQQQIFY